MLKRNYFHSIFAVVLMVIGMTGCKNATEEYSHRACYVVIDNSTHLDATLASSLNSMTPGIFCLIEKTQKGSATYYHCENNQGLSSDILWSAVDQRLSAIVGMNNGIIVGFGNLDNPAVFYAYDRECPNCFNPDGVPIKDRPLTMDEKGHATCNVCKRVYDMNNRGYVFSGEAGEPLTRYPASTSGPYGTLAVQ